MSEYVDKAMELARIFSQRDCEAVFASETDAYWPAARERDNASAALRTHLESHEATLRLAMDALESCDGDDGLKGYRQFHDEKLVEPAIAAIKQALEPK